VGRMEQTCISPNRNLKAQNITSIVENSENRDDLGGRSVEGKV
jgi:hypothetical protein